MWKCKIHPFFRGKTFVESRTVGILVQLYKSLCVQNLRQYCKICYGTQSLSCMQTSETKISAHIHAMCSLRLHKKKPIQFLKKIKGQTLQGKSNNLGWCHSMIGMLTTFIANLPTDSLQHFIVDISLSSLLQTQIRQTIHMNCQDIFSLKMKIHSNQDSSNTDDSFTMANSSWSLSPYEILPIAPETNIWQSFYAPASDDARGI